VPRVTSEHKGTAAGPTHCDQPRNRAGIRVNPKQLGSQTISLPAMRETLEKCVNDATISRWKTHNDETLN